MIVVFGVPHVLLLAAHLFLIRRAFARQAPNGDGRGADRFWRKTPARAGLLASLGIWPAFAAVAFCAAPPPDAMAALELALPTVAVAVFAFLVACGLAVALQTAWGVLGGRPEKEDDRDPE